MDESDVYGLGAKAQAASSLGLGRKMQATATTQATNSYGKVSYDAKAQTFQQRKEQEAQAKREILSSMKTLQRQTKGFHAQSLPLFISPDYANLLENTKFRRELGARDSPVGDADGADDGDAQKKQQFKGASRMYRNQWMLLKLQQQTEARRKKRGKKAEAPTPPTEKPGKNQKANVDEVAELELVIDNLKNEITLKDEEFLETRKELDALKVQSEYLRTAHGDEKNKRQSLETSKQKYMVLKEFMAYQEPIKTGHFLDQQREKKKASQTSGCFKAQLE